MRLAVVVSCRYALRATRYAPRSSGISSSPLWTISAEKTLGGIYVKDVVIENPNLK